MADESRTAEIIVMKRRELAALQTSELNDALFPVPAKNDDAFSDDEKADIQAEVAGLVEQHRREVAAWEQANG